MDWAKALYALLIALPELIKLIRSVQDVMKEQEVKGKVKDGIKQVHEALAANNAEHLNRIFTVNK